jgi:hypothetical protein
VSVPRNKFEFEYLVRMNLIYHERRERELSSFLRWTSFTSVLLSSGMVISLTSAVPWLAYVFGAIVTVLNAASLGFDWQGQLTTHSRFRSKWNALAIHVGLLRDDDRAGFDGRMQEMRQIQEDEPPPDENKLSQAVQLTNKAFGLTASPWHN